MTDNQSLLLVFVALYLWESLVWLPKDSLAFLAPWEGAFRVIHPWPVLGRHRTGALVGNLLPPLAAPLLAHPWPVSVTPNALYAYVSQALHPDGRAEQPGTFARWSEVTSLEVEGRKVLVNGAPFLTAPSDRVARALGARLHRIWKEAPEHRSAAIDALLDESLDVDQVRARVDTYRKRIAATNFFCTFLWGLLFVIGPILVIRFTLALAILFIVPLLCALLVAVGICYWRAHRTLFPRDRGERLRHLPLLLLYPPLAIRAVDRLGAIVVDAFDPLAVGVALLEPEALRKFARTVVLDLRHPLEPACPAEEPDRREAEGGFRSALRSAVERVLRSRNLDPDELTRPPAPIDAQSRSYCPRCLDQYVLTEGRCSDCGGLTLKPLASAPVS